MNAEHVTALLRAYGLRPVPRYWSEGIAVESRAGVTVLRCMGPAQTRLAEAATVILEHAGVPVEPVEVGKLSTVYTFLRV